MSGNEDALGRAVSELKAAQTAVIEARRSLSAMIIAERRAGVPVDDLAARTQMTPVEIRNVLSVVGLT
jgi:flagellar biosynthesis regulator FlaF